MSPNGTTQSAAARTIGTPRAARKREILSTYYPDYIPRHIDEQIRAKHDIKLPRSVMEPGDPRWA
jgi:hypothetical protein